MVMSLWDWDEEKEHISVLLPPNESHLEKKDRR